MHKKLKILEEKLREFDKLVLAFSGGVDSSFLLHTASRILGRENILAVTITGRMYPEKEKQASIDICKRLGISQELIEIDVDSLEVFQENTKDRCYHCKKLIFQKIIDLAQERDIDQVIDGTNYDDLDDYRPGLRAIKELNVLSPLKEAGLTKEEIRELSKVGGIETWNKVSMACLASRIPYGQEINSQKLGQVEACEGYLNELGYLGSRVRYHDEISRIELKSEDMIGLLESGQVEDLVAFFKKQGFTYITLDIEGYKMGSMNDLLGKEV